MKKKKALIIANSTGGLYLFRKELIMELKKKYDISLAAPVDDNRDELEELGCTIISTQMDRRGINPLKDLKLIYTYQKIVKSIKPDIVITYTIKPNIYGGFVCRINKISYASNITGLGSAFEKDNILKKLVVFMYKIALKRVKIVFFENSENRNKFLEEKIISRNRTCLLNGAGVNLEHFALQSYPQNEIFRFLFIGRIMKEKGVDELFLAMKRLRKSGNNCVLDVLGKYEENYRVKIEKYEKEGWLCFHGFQNDVRPFIRSCDCFVLPSYHEGMANTNLECAASGRPVITSSIPGCKEAVIDGKSGFLCKCKEISSLYDAMLKILSCSLEERKQMGEYGRKHMKKNFDKNKIVEKTTAYLLK